MADYKTLIGIFTLVVGFLGYVPYFIGIYRGRAHPHIFSWFIWGLLTAIAWAAQITGHAGPGAWVTGGTALLCFSIAAAAAKQGEKDITRTDIITFIAALTALPLWYFTDSPYWSVWLVTIIDALAFYPTLRKSWHKPAGEVPVTYIISGLKFGLALTAMDTVNFVTAFYPASLVVMNAAFVVMVFLRRKKLGI